MFKITHQGNELFNDSLSKVDGFTTRTAANLAIQCRSEELGNKFSEYSVVEYGSPVTDDPDKPDHYIRLTPEPIDVISAWGLDFSLGSAIKYIARAGHKQGEPEQVALKKAVSFLQKRIARLEATGESNNSESPSRQRFDRTVGPRSTRAAILAIIRAINDAC